VNTAVRRLALVAMVMCVALMVSSTWVQFVKADELNNDGRNTRTMYRTIGDARGSIVVAGTTVAASVAVDDPYGFQRVYAPNTTVDSSGKTVYSTESDTAQAVLYSSITGFFGFSGRAGLEKYGDEYLSSESNHLVFTRLRDLLTGQPPQGASIETTIVPEVQEAAMAALRCERASARCLPAPDGHSYLEGAIVAVEPSTGKILALVSTPGFDPNPVASHGAATSTRAYCELEGPSVPGCGNLDPPVTAPAAGLPLRNKAISERYFPGSTFKLVTAAAALESGRYSSETMLYGPRVLDLPQTNRTMTNYGGSACDPHSDEISLANSLKVSCNTSFAQLGIDLGDDAIRRQAQAFGFDGARGEVRIPMPVARSQFPEDLDAPHLAYASIGQDSVQATPLQMAMVSAAIANNGTMMKPYLIDTVRAPNLSVLSVTRPTEIGAPVSSSTAHQLTSMMELVVNEGSATPARIPGVRVAAKTGTAQDSNRSPHVWFTGFAPADNPQVAVVVFVKNGGDSGDAATGGKVAAPMAKQVIEAVLNR